MSTGDKGRSASVSSQPTSRLDEVRVQALSQEYKTRLDSLYLQISQIHKSLLSDDLLHTMKKDPTTAQYLSDRAKEITESALLSEQEATISRLISDLAAAKSTIAHLETILDDRQKTVCDLSESLKYGLNQNSPSMREVEEAEMKAAVATKELARARIELEEEIENSAKLRSMNSILETKIRALEVTLERNHLEMTESDEYRGEVQGKVRELAGENNELRRQIDTYEREIKELEGKYLAYSGEFKEMLTVSMGKQTQTYKERSQQFKHKILKQREAIKALEESQSSLQSDFDALFASKKQLELKVATLESELHSKSSETHQITREYEVKTSEMTLSLQNTMEARLSALKTQYEEMLTAAKAKEDHLLKTLESKIADFQSNYIKTQTHEEILNKELEKVRKKSTEEKITLEKEINSELQLRISALKDEFGDEKRRLAGRISDLESDKSNFLNRKKDLERQIEEAEMRIRELNTRLAKSSIEVETISEQRNAESVKLQESELATAKYKEMYDKEYALRLRLEGEISRMKADLSASFSKGEELDRALGETKLQLHAKIREMNTHIEQLSRENEELGKDLRQVSGRSQALEEEKAQTLQRLSRSSQEQISTLERMREQEKMTFVAEADAFNHTKALLTSQIDTLRRENSLQKLRDKSLLSNIVKDYKTQLRELKRNLVRELTEFRRVMSESVTGAAVEIDKQQVTTERRINHLLSTSKDLINSLNYEKESLQLASQQSMENQSLTYEHKIRSLESLLNDLRAQVSGKTDQLEGVLEKLETFRGRERELKIVCEDLETWKNASFAVEEKNVALRERLQDLEKVVDSLKTRNEENMRYFEQEITALTEKYRQVDEKRTFEIAKSHKFREDETRKIDSELKSLKSTTVVNLTSLESDLSVLLKTIQSDEQRHQTEHQKLRAESDQLRDSLKKLKLRTREEGDRAEQAEKRRSALEVELRETKEDLVRLQLREVRAEMEKTEAVVRESKERLSS